MTCREKLKIDKPDGVGDGYIGGCFGCPNDYYPATSVVGFCNGHCGSEDTCRECWDQIINEEPDYSELSVDGCEGSLECCGVDRENVGQDIDGEPRIVEEAVDAFNAVGNPNVVSSENLRHILDSGSRRKFETGAVRDIQEGKGRCDLMPLDVVADYYCDCEEQQYILYCLAEFIDSGLTNPLYQALNTFARTRFKDSETMFLEVSKHFEDGAKKYGENNWQKGIPVHCYIDSAVRHYLKFLRGDKDESHDRAFCWNIMCAIWTCKHKPELNEYANQKS